jgi:hypothetical protein
MTRGFVVNSQRGAPIERRRDASSRPVDEHQLLALQRQLGNQAVLRLLQAEGTVVARAPAPTVLGERSVSQQDLNWLTDAQQWAASVRQGGEEYLKCYAEIATLLQADKVEDVKGTAVGDINGALRAGFSELKPGLNWVRNLGSRGRTGYLYDGKWTSTLPDTATGDEPKVAVVLSASAFDPDNKAFTLGVLRHELEHAVHNRMAADWLMRWRGDAKARRQPFASWLRRQAIGPAERALVEERLAGGISSTEALANLEGFMAAFATEAPGLSLADAPAEEELKDAANFWLTADERVQEEVRARLTAYGARLTGDTRKRFLDTLERLEAENPRWKRLFDPVIKAEKAKKSR